jgi:hypothetical protein
MLAVSESQRRAVSTSACERAATLFALAVAIESLLHLWLYLRPNPFGRPFALDPGHYLFHAIYYGAWAQAMIAAPFLAWAQWHERRGLPLGSRPIALQIGVTTALLVLGAVDRECQRFLGMHIGVDWLQTYFGSMHVPAVIVRTIAEDRGGAWSSLTGIACAVAYAPVAIVAARRVRWPALRLPGLRPLGFAALVVLPTVLWVWVPGGKNRQAKVRPVLLTILRELHQRHPPPPGAGELAEATAVFQDHWRAGDRRRAWAFDDPARPLVRRHVGLVPAAPAARPSFVVVQLETFRAKDMGSMNPELVGDSPTPFIDGLARDSNSGAWVRYYASAVPTVHATLAIHTGLPMHPRRSIASEATTVHIEGIPDVLRRHGYRTLHFTGSDPDWDGQRVWLDRWYDEVHYWPEHAEADRPTFRAAAARIREVAAGGQPFFAYIVSISNHSPFRSPEPQLDTGSGSGDVLDALHDTMHYTDDVVRELFETLSVEPWFEHTIFVITGDHGYDLGDRGEAGGFENLRHETTWVPLVVHGRDPRLPRGETTCVASHVDLAPTIAELAGAWDDQSYVGHSLIDRDCERATAVILRLGHWAVETDALSFYKPRDGALMAYAGDDRVQTRLLADVEPTRAIEAARLAAALELLTAHTIDRDLVARR